MFSEPTLRNAASITSGSASPFLSVLKPPREARTARPSTQASAKARSAAATAASAPAPVVAPVAKIVVDDALVKRFQPAIRRIAYRIAGRLPPHVLVEDLISAGYLGLIDAASKFDPARGIPFAAYAEIRMRGAMIDELRAQDWIPRAHRDRVEKMERAQTDVQRRTGRHAEVEEVAAELGLTVDEYRETRERALPLAVVSLDEPARSAGGASEPSHGLWAQDVSAERDDEADAPTLRAMLGEALKELPERLRAVASLYYFEETPLKDIGRAQGVTESRACQLRGEAVRRLRTHMRRAVGEVSAAA
ncbi:MAG TPA: FliA/WhiG family RNA polymerase sigma factor [Myxococcota bacterium]|jgi:RNA polymerase sigma factor for flagellar operon FliA|nr:FliA/WhiG family RNA polymerase sigma factor [Myxococcota bacterium]